MGCGIARTKTPKSESHRRDFQERTNFEQKLADTIYDTITFARTKAPVHELGHARWETPQEPGPQRGVESSESQPPHSFLQYLQQIWLCVIVYCAAAIRQKGQAGFGG